MVRTADGADLSDVNDQTVQLTQSTLSLSNAYGQAFGQLRMLGAEGVQFNKVLGDGVDKLAGRMTSAFERFARTGKLSFDDLKSSAIAALDEIYNQAISAGLESIFGGSAGGGFFGGLVQAAIGSFAPRAQGGPVSAGRQYLVGESGPEFFVPRSDGTVLSAPAAQAAPINITINMTGNGSQPGLRQSASQIASQVSRAVQRAQRNG